MQQLTNASNHPVSASASDCAEQIIEVTPLIMRHIRKEMRRRALHGLSIPQFRALAYVQRHRGASLSHLAEFLGLSLPATSKLVQKFVEQKVVVRRAGKDRRRICLSLTEQGQAALLSARLGTRQQLTESLRLLPQEELVVVSAALRSLERAFSHGSTHVNLP